LEAWKLYTPFLFIFIIGITLVPDAFAQQMPEIDTSIVDQADKMLETSERILDKTEIIMEKTETIMEQGSELAAKAESVSGQLGISGCLIATATFGSELAPQVQQLRELRDNTLLKTSSGSSFMTGFNQIYYSFSPTIANWERQNPIFKEVVKIAITPLLTSLSILNYVDMDSESEVLGCGIGIIMMNVGMYFVAPAIVISRLFSKS